MSHRLFALEHYDRSDGHAVTGPGSTLTTGDTRLVAAVHLPADDVVLALVEGPDPETVAAVAAAAGWRVDRVTPAVWIASKPESTRPEPNRPETEGDEQCGD